MRTPHFVWLLSVLALVATLAAGAAQASPSSTWQLGAYGTPTVDGIVSPSEWQAAPAAYFPVNHPLGGQVVAEFRAMNDAANLYLLMQMPYDGPYLTLFFGVLFDNNGNGLPGLEEGDDYLAVNGGWYPWDPSPQVNLAIDGNSTYLSPCSSGICTIADTMNGGINDVSASIGRSSGWITIELEHPLGSMDSRDFNLAGGETLGWSMTVQMVVPEMADTYGIGEPNSTIKIYEPPIETLFSNLSAAVIGVGPGTSLADKVAEAHAAYAAGDTPITCEILNAFINQVEAQSGKSIDAQTTAPALIADATRIRAVLGC